jgi:hypothetical protein
MKIIGEDVSKFEERIIPKEKTILPNENTRDGSIER